MPSTATTPWGRAFDEAGNRLLQPPIGGFGHVWTHGPRNRKQIALTYDDGPNAPSTRDVLAVLARYGVKATFFAVGCNAQRHPDLIRQIAAEGHIVGNHSMHHSRKAGLQWNEEAHIDDCTETLTDLIGRQPSLYRAPWGWLTPWETQRLRSRRFSIIGWDIYTYDWQTPMVEGTAIADGVVRDIQPGSIILLHDGIAGIETAEKPQTVTATEQIICHLHAEGYEFVTVPDLLGINAYC